MIRINNLNFGYRKGNPLFSSLSCEFKAGSIYGLLGRNGAGKTTLLKLISGLLYPKSGECNVLGYGSAERHPAVLQQLFIVPENFYLPPLTIKRYAEINSPFYPKFSQAEFNKYLEEFELSPNQNLSSLSFGQKKKAFLAFGLATNTSILILDEPTNALDIPSKAQFRRLLANVITENRCIIISTHQVRDLDTLFDPIMIVEKGQVIFNQPLDRISERLRFTKLDSTDGVDGLLYAEEMMGGYSAIVRNSKGLETRPNLELLFNGILQNQKEITELF